jgi:ABC-type sugar transport system permease subunit
LLIGTVPRPRRHRIVVLNHLNGWPAGGGRGQGIRARLGPAGIGGSAGCRRWAPVGLAPTSPIAVWMRSCSGGNALTDFAAVDHDGINGGVPREPSAADRADRLSVDLTCPPGGAPVGRPAGGIHRRVWLVATSAMFPAFSFLWMIVSVGLQAVVGIAVATVLERPGLRFMVFWRTLFILPWAIPEFAGAIAWRTIVDPASGWVALLLGSPFAWPDSPDAALLVLLVVGTWVGWPLMMLVAIAGLRTIPGSIGDAARLDGAGAVARFRRITLPLLLPLLAPALVIRAVAAFNQFYLFYVLRAPDPTITSATFSYYVFDSSGGPGLFAVSAAINMLTLIALAVVVIWFLRWRDRAERVAFW